MTPEDRAILRAAIKGSGETPLDVSEILERIDAAGVFIRHDASLSVSQALRAIVPALREREHA